MEPKPHLDPKGNEIPNSESASATPPTPEPVAPPAPKLEPEPQEIPREVERINDQNGRLTQINFSDGSKAFFHLNGSPYSKVLPDGSSVNYDDKGNVTKRLDAEGKEIPIVTPTSKPESQQEIPAPTVAEPVPATNTPPKTEPAPQAEISTTESGLLSGFPSPETVKKMEAEAKANGQIFEDGSWRNRDSINGVYIREGSDPGGGWRRFEGDELKLIVHPDGSYDYYKNGKVAQSSKSTERPAPVTPESAAMPPKTETPPAPAEKSAEEKKAEAIAKLEKIEREERERIEAGEIAKLKEEISEMENELYYWKKINGRLMSLYAEINDIILIIGEGQNALIGARGFFEKRRIKKEIKKLEKILQEKQQEAGELERQKKN